MEQLGKMELSIVIPSFNEEGNIDVLYKELTKVLVDLKLSYEIIFVDDGSRDRTWEKISELSKIDKNIKGLNFSKNFGHQYALFAGLVHSKGEAVIVMDGDMQHPPNVIPILLKKWKEGFDIVNTVRLDHQKISFFKKLTSKWFYKLFSYLSGEDLSAGMADFRLFDRKVINEFIKLNEAGLFIRGLVSWMGYKSTSIEFQCGERFSGSSKYTLSKMLKFAWIAITSFSIKPLRLGITLGVVTSILAFCELLFALYAYFFTNSTVPGWVSVIVVITFLFGVLFLVIGLIGEYIGRILVEVRSRPRFIVKEKQGFTF